MRSSTAKIEHNHINLYNQQQGNLIKTQNIVYENQILFINHQIHPDKVQQYLKRKILKISAQNALIFSQIRQKNISFHYELLDVSANFVLKVPLESILAKLINEKKELQDQSFASELSFRNSTQPNSKLKLINIFKDIWDRKNIDENNSDSLIDTLNKNVVVVKQNIKKMIQQQYKNELDSKDYLNLIELNQSYKRQIQKLKRLADLINQQSSEKVILKKDREIIKLQERNIDLKKQIDLLRENKKQMQQRQLSYINDISLLKYELNRKQKNLSKNGKPHLIKKYKSVGSQKFTVQIHSNELDFTEIRESEQQTTILLQRIIDFFENNGKENDWLSISSISNPLEQIQNQNFNESCILQNNREQLLKDLNPLIESFQNQKRPKIKFPRRSMISFLPQKQNSNTNCYQSSDRLAAIKTTKFIRTNK